MTDRREFIALFPALLALGAASPAESQAAKPTADLKPLKSGIFKPGPVKAGQQGHTSQPFLTGMLSAGNIRLEMHESTQQPGAPHEAIGTHQHNEIWCVKTGVATLSINGTEHRLEAGDVGLVCAGDEHWIANAGPTELSYFVIAAGPPE